jgi:two-component system NarL family sensor kinase
LTPVTFAVRGFPSPELRFPRSWENFPQVRDSTPLLPVSGVRHARLIAANVVTRITRRHAAGWAPVSLVITMVGVVAAIVLLTTGGTPAELRRGMITALLTIVPYGLAGSVLISRRPDLPFGWLLSGAAAALVLCLVTLGPASIAVAHGHSGPLALWGLSMSSLWFVPIAIQGLINVRFPSGRPASRWGRMLELMLVGGICLVVLGGMFGATTVRDLLPDSAPQDLRHPLTGGTRVGAIADALASLAPLVVLLGLAAGVGVVVRCWRAAGIERQQLKWRAAGVIFGLALFPLAVTERTGPVLDSLDSSIFVATLAVPVLRYRLWAIDSIIRRSAVYAAVTAVLVAGYALITAVGAGLVSERVGASVAAAGVALAFAPVRNLTQRLVDRLFYGQRSDPYRALSDVGHRLDTVAAAGGVLPAVVSAVAASLRLPYVAIERPGDGSVLAAWGDATLAKTAGVERWGLSYQGAPVGFLAASPRRGEAAFDERDRKVLADIARQAGPAVRAEALTADLLDSRQRLVTAREEERRRLRRDLHDGLGPMLTGLGLNLDAARTRLAAALHTHAADAEIARADEFLARAKQASSQVIKDLRGMVYELRPPSLDDLGLVGAVRLHAERHAAGADLQVDIDAVGLPDLPAAVEVAAFRTAVEAITNAVRHGDAQHCTVRLTAYAGQELILDVSDDGRSPTPWRPGVGLTAMRERAEELGGTLTAGPSLAGGHVIARYPLSPSGTKGVHPTPHVYPLSRADDEFSGVVR